MSLGAWLVLCVVVAWLLFTRAGNATILALAVCLALLVLAGCAPARTLEPHPYQACNVSQAARQSYLCRITETNGDDMTINALQEQINTASDARLRRRIDERLDPIRQQVSGMPEFEFDATDVTQSAQPVRVRMTPTELVNLIAEAAFIQRRDQARNRATRDFLDQVAAAGIEP